MRCLFLLPAIIFAGTTYAHLPGNCQEFDNEKQRLACYDALYASPGAAAEAAEPRRIEARIVGNFTGWSGKTQFVLDNGQVWRQVNNNTRDYRVRKPIPQPEVVITRSALGGYNMKITGVSRTVKVRLVQ